MEHLLNLGDGVFKHIWGYLHLREMVPFDLAVCNTDLRGTYLLRLAGLQFGAIKTQAKPRLRRMHGYLAWLSSRRVYPPGFQFDTRGKRNDSTVSKKSVLEFQSLIIHREVFKHLHSLDFSASTRSLREADSKVAMIIEAAGGTLQEASIRLSDHTFAFETLHKFSANLKRLDVGFMGTDYLPTLPTNAYPIIQTLSNLRELKLSSYTINSLALATALQASRISLLELEKISVANPTLTEYPNGTNVLETLVIDGSEIPLAFVHNCLRTRVGLRRFQSTWTETQNYRESDQCDDVTCELILRWSPNITEIFIRESAAYDRTVITASGLNELLKLRKLETFVLPGTFIMEFENMSLVASNCVEYVNDNRNLTQLGVNFFGVGADIMYGAIHNQSLKKMIINLTYFITDEAIEKIMVQCPNLTSIVLYGDGDYLRLQDEGQRWKGPTDASIRLIGYHCQQLEELTLCPTIFTPRAIRTLMASISRRTRPLTLTLLEGEADNSFHAAVEEFRQEQRLSFKLAERGNRLRSTRRYIHQQEVANR